MNEFAAARLGALMALASSVTWAYASTRFAQFSREIGAVRVNLARAIVVSPVYVAIALSTRGAGALVSGLTPTRVGWLLVSVLCSYAIADNLFFSAAQHIGIATALSIASTYPLWAALVGAVAGHEPFGPARICATLLCVGGVIALVRLAPAANRETRVESATGSAKGVVLALFASLLWAGNTVAIKQGASGLYIPQVNAVRYLMALGILGAQLKLTRIPAPQPRPTRGWLALLPPIFFDGILGSVFYVYGVAHTDLVVGATLSSLSPLISVPFAIGFGEERWSPAHFSAVTATVTGVVMLVSTG